MKDRVGELERLGVSSHQICKRVPIPYMTIASWRRDQAEQKTTFLPVKIVDRPTPAPITVTVETQTLEASQKRKRGRPPLQKTSIATTVTVVTSDGLRVFVFSESVDLRAGFDRLTYLVHEKRQSKLVDGDWFVFFGRNRKKVEMIYCDGTGVVLVNKRLERGRFMSLFDLEHREISVDELDILIAGGIVRRPVFGKLPLTTLPLGNQPTF